MHNTQSHIIITLFLLHCI